MSKSAKKIKAICKKTKGMNALIEIEETSRRLSNYYSPKFDEGARDWVYFKVIHPVTGRITKLYKVHDIHVGNGLSSFEVFEKTGDGVAVAIYDGIKLVRSKAEATRKITSLAKKVKETFPWVHSVEVKVHYGARRAELRATL